MAKNNSVQKTDEYVNKTGTDLEILQRLEKAYYDNNGYNARRNIKKSMNWFRNRITKNYKNVRTARMFRDRDLWKNNVTLGHTYFFNYDPVHKASLPLYDRFPLVTFFNSYKSSEGKEILLGISWHYLAPALRMEAFRALLKYKNNDRFNKRTKINADWQVMMALSQSKYFEHAVHAYRADHIKSKLVYIPAQAYEIVLFLPTARFTKGTKTQAWKL